MVEEKLRIRALDRNLLNTQVVKECIREEEFLHVNAMQFFLHADSYSSEPTPCTSPTHYNEPSESSQEEAKEEELQQTLAVDSELVQ